MRQGATGGWSGDRKQSTLWTIPARDDDGLGHGTQKPVECMRRPVANNSNAGQVVFDPFLGSGTTAIAAEKMGRICYGCEIDEAYCDVIIERWQAFTGKAAVLADGRSFEAVHVSVQASAISRYMRAPLADLNDFDLEAVLGAQDGKGAAQGVR